MVKFPQKKNADDPLYEFYNEGYNAAIDDCKRAINDEHTLDMAPGDCHVCNEKTNSWGANPSEWGIFLAHIDGIGKHRYYHVKCLYPLLKALNDNGHKHWIDGTITGECNCNAQQEIDKETQKLWDNLLLITKKMEETEKMYFDAKAKLSARHTENENKLVRLDEEELRKFIIIENHKAEEVFDKQYGPPAQLAKVICEKYGVPMQVPSEIDIDVAIQDMIIKEYGNVFKVEPLFRKKVTKAIQNLLTGEKS